jgi:hypothetical protein
MSQRRKGQCGEYRKVFISHTIPPASAFCLEGTTDSGPESSGLVYVRMPGSMRAREDSAVHMTPFPSRTREGLSESPRRPVLRGSLAGWIAFADESFSYTAFSRAWR